MHHGHVTISWHNFKHLHWSGNTDVCGAFSFLGIHRSPILQIKTIWWIWKNFSVPGFQEIHSFGSTVRLSMVQKKNYFCHHPGLFCHTASLSVFIVS